MLNRNFILILLGNVILGSAMPLLIVLGGLAGAWLAPQSWLATALPSIQMLAGIAVASPISMFMGRYGRRAGFLLGAAALIIGAALAIVAVYSMSFVLLCMAHIALGAALICVNFFRFAASEAVSEAHRPQAISFTLASGLVAALIGPELFSWSKDALAPIPFAGAYAAVLALGVVGLVPVFGLAMPAVQPSQTARAAISVKNIILRNPRISLSMSVAALSQAVMVLLMTPTPLAMVGCGFVETQAADVIRWHVVAMFAPGFFTGWFIARFGAGRIATCGVSLLLVAALTAWMGMELLNFYAALIVLGVGWNFAFVSATHILQSELNDDEAPLLQGANDTILAIASAVASLISGALYMGVGWVGLATFALPVPLVIGFLLLQAQRRAPPSNITVSD